MTLAFTRTLREIWPQTPDQHAAVIITGMTSDSRDVSAGDVFIAQKGLRRDARDFVADVIARGAAAVLVERDEKWPEHRIVNNVPVLVVEALMERAGEIASRFYGEPSQAMTVFAVTGTNGKTSVAHLLAGALTRLGKKAAVLGTVGNGLYGQLAYSTHTTLDPIHLQQLLAEFRAAGAEYVALEASSHGLEQGRLNGTRIHTALFTNLTRDHLDYHGTMQAYAAAKGRLFSWPGLCAAVLNADDSQFNIFRTTLAADVPLCSYSILSSQAADLVAEHIEPSLAGLQVDVRTAQGVVQLHSKLLGRFNVSNLLAVLGGLLTVGVSLPAALDALADVAAVPGRMECFTLGNAPTVVVDYAHTPDALEKALVSLREHTKADLWCVFGCGGDRDRGKRPQMATVVEHMADHIVLTSDNPRSERPEAIIADIEAGFHAPRGLLVELDRRSAIRAAINAAMPDDIVLVAGKGHEAYQEIAGVKYPFSDVQEVQAALALRGAA
jgi:UDP-N-acetylmuramyl-tripeptide synthetase